MRFGSVMSGQPMVADDLEPVPLTQCRASGSGPMIRADTSPNAEVTIQMYEAARSKARHSGVRLRLVASVALSGALGIATEHVVSVLAPGSPGLAIGMAVAAMPISGLLLAPMAPGPAAALNQRSADPLRNGAGRCSVGRPDRPRKPPRLPGGARPTG